MTGYLTDLAELARFRGVAAASKQIDSATANDYACLLGFFIIALLHAFIWHSCDVFEPDWDAGLLFEVMMKLH